MKLTDYEKLSIMLLCDILDGKREFNTDLLREAIYSDNTWAIAWQYSIPFEDQDPPEHVQRTVDILDMFEYLELSFDALNDEEKQEVQTECGSGARYQGFDGNNESVYMGCVEILVNHMDRFGHFKGRESLNSHSHVLPGYLRMLEKFRATPKSGGHTFTKQAIINIVKASHHPR